jgi:AraC-like DNA-binding protein
MATIPLPATALALHAVLDGPIVMRRIGSADLILERGDTIVTKAAATVGFSSGSTTPLVPFIEYWRARKLPEELTARSRRRAPIRYGPASDDSVPRLLTIAYVLHEPERSPLMAVLPDISLVPHHANSIAGCLPAMLDWLVREDSTAKPGYVGPGTKIAELLLTGFVRDFVLLLPSERLGWLSALRDERIGKVLAAIHAEPEKEWSLAGLAAEANMSRSLFAARFSTMVGKPPMAYLAEQRMKEAASMIRGRGRSVAMVAEYFGYRSEAAFRTAFKKYWHSSPRDFAKAGV